MKTYGKMILGAVMGVMVAIPAMAQPANTVTTKTTGVSPDGSVQYQSRTTVTRAPIKPGAVTFYYYDPAEKSIVSGNELTDDLIRLWDRNNNNVIDNHEFYNNALVVYEPIEYTSRTFKDVDGRMKLTKEEYTIRLQQLPSYRNLNKDGAEGLTLYEFLGVGFQDADLNNDNQVSYKELKTAFYAKEGLIRKPLKLN